MNDCSPDEVDEACSEFTKYMEFIETKMDSNFLQLYGFAQRENENNEKIHEFQLYTKLPYTQTLRQYLEYEPSRFSEDGNWQ